MQNELQTSGFDRTFFFALDPVQVGQQFSRVRIITTTLLFASLTSLASAADMGRSVVQVLLYSQTPVWDAPWRSNPVAGSSGSGFVIDGERVMTSREALAMQKMPKSIVIIGAGAIGVEFAYFLNAFGCEVTLVEMLERIVPVEDGEVSAALARAFKKLKISVHIGTKVEDIEVGKDSVAMNLVKGDKSERKEAESLLLAIGVEAYTEGLLSAKVKPKTDSDYVVVDDQYQTSVDGIYAAGDLIGPPWLAHVATFEAVQAVNGIFGQGTPERVKVFPSCTYCLPQVASIGLTEEKAKENGIAYKVGKFPFSASGARCRTTSVPMEQRVWPSDFESW